MQRNTRFYISFRLVLSSFSRIRNDERCKITCERDRALGLIFYLISLAGYLII